MIKSLLLILVIQGTESADPVDARYDIRAMYQYYLRLQACQKSFPEEQEFSRILFELKQIAKMIAAQLSQAEIEVEWNNQARIFAQSGMNGLLNGGYWFAACNLHTSEAAQKIWQLRRQPAQPFLPKKDF
jgi:hypothetical protein